MLFHANDDDHQSNFKPLPKSHNENQERGFYPKTSVLVTKLDCLLQLLKKERESLNKKRPALSGWLDLPRFFASGLQMFSSNSLLS